jgi:glycosyltransferase involved in cell wall biosynthesis
VRLLGFVPDVAPAIRAAAIYVVPLRAGSGTRLKILEAMAFGKAIVTTRIGAEGIALEHGVDAVFADDAESFAAAVLRLLDAPDEAARLGAAARAKAVARYDWDAIGAALGPLYSDLAERARQR